MVSNDNFFLRAKVEAAEGWHEWIEKVPLIPFPAGRQIRMRPPFGGALVRFHVFGNGKSVSVYLDVNDSLGYMQQPYWEVYPVNEENERALMDDVPGLLRLIAIGLGYPSTGLEAPDIIEGEGSAASADAARIGSDPAEGE